jgi:hypothetical protein
MHTHTHTHTVLFLSSSLNTYYAILEDPKRTLVELGNFLPNISSFYIAYVMIKVRCVCVA